MNENEKIMGFKKHICKCKMCKKDFEEYLGPADYCEDCAIKFAEKKQKHEEIKRMAFKFYKDMLMDQIHKEKSPCFKVYHQAWIAAEQFYDFAKQKEKEVSHD